MDKIRTTAIHPQLNSIFEKKRTLPTMLAKRADEDRTTCSFQLLYVLMALRSSVQEATGFTPLYLVFGHELSLPLDLMYQHPLSETPKHVTSLIF